MQLFEVLKKGEQKWKNKIYYKQTLCITQLKHILETIVQITLKINKYTKMKATPVIYSK